MDKILKYTKGVVAAVGILATIVVAAVQDQAIDLTEASGIWTAVVGLGAAFGVVASPKNREG